MISREEVLSMMESQKVALKLEILEQVKSENNDSSLETEMIHRSIRTEVNEQNEEILEQAKLENNASPLETETFIFATNPVQPKIDSQSVETGPPTYILGCIPRMGRYPPLTELNTRTLSLYAVAKVADKDAHIVKKSIISIMSLVFGCLQVFIMFVIVFDSAYPKCYSMADCPLGTYCTGKSFTIPTCFDCSKIKNLETDLATCPTTYPDKWEKWDLVDIDHKELWVQSKVKNSTFLDCASYKHCQENEIDEEVEDFKFKGHCDFVHLYRSKMDKGVWIFAGLLALLWVHPISQDIEEAAIEERVLNYHIAGYNSIPAEIMRMALSIRRFILPFMAVSANVILILTDDISTKHLFLNFLSITFIMESDNVLAMIFLRSSQTELMEKAVESIAVEKLQDIRFFFLCRMQGLLCATVLMIGLANVDNNVSECGELISYLTTLYFCPFLAVIIAQACSTVFKKRENESKWNQILEALVVFSRNFVVYLISTLFDTGFFRVLYGNEGEFDESVKKRYGLFIAFPPVYLGLVFFKQKYISNRSNKTKNEQELVQVL